MDDLNLDRQGGSDLDSNSDEDSDLDSDYPKDSANKGNSARRLNSRRQRKDRSSRDSNRNSLYDSSTEKDGVIDDNDIEAFRRILEIPMVMRSSPANGDYLKAAAIYNYDPRWDIARVKDKYGHLSGGKDAQWLIERLGTAITRRRQYLRYRQDHHQKLSRDWDERVEKSEMKDTKSISTMASTKATTFAPDEMYLRRETSSISVWQASYAVSVISDPQTRVIVPPPPKTGSKGVPYQFGAPFQCPYCFEEHIVKNRTAWK